MKTPVARKPPRIPDLRDPSKQGMPAWMAQVRTAVNWLADNAITSLAGVARNGAGAVLGLNVFDTNGNLVTQIGSELIESGAINDSHLADDSVSEGALQDDSVNDAHIQAGAVQGTHVADQSLNNDHVIPDQSLVSSAGVTTDLAIDLSLAAHDSGTGFETVINADTVNLNDGAGLGITGDATQISNLPPTVDAAIALGMMVDTQKSIGVATAVRQALFSDGGIPYFADLFSGVVDGGVMGGSNFMSNDAALTGSMATYGNKWIIPNIFPGAITVLAFAQANAFVTTGATGGGANAASCQLQISLDGGSTWTTSAQLGSTRIPDINHTYPLGMCLHSVTGTPTGSIQVRLQVAHTAGTDGMTLQAGTSALGYVILNSSNGIISGNTNFAASLPSTASLSCSGTYPTTQCTVTKNITVIASGGLPTFSFSNVKTAGTGTITAGATSQTMTVSDTETTGDAGPTHTTTVQSTVTDSQTYTASGSESGTTVTLTLAAAALIAVGTLFDVAVTTGPAGYAKTGAVALSGTTGTTLKYTASSSGLGALTSATVSNVRIITNTCVFTGTFNRSYPAVSVSLSSTGGTCVANPPPEGSGICTAKVSLTTNASGGDGSFTYSNIVLSGSGTVTSGSTLKNWVVSDTDTAPFSASGTVKSTVTDGHSNTANKTKTVSFSGSVSR